MLVTPHIFAVESWVTPPTEMCFPIMLAGWPIYIYIIYVCTYIYIYMIYHVYIYMIYHVYNRECSPHTWRMVDLPNKNIHLWWAPLIQAAVRQLQSPAKELCCALAVRHWQLQVTQLSQPTKSDVSKGTHVLDFGVQKCWSSPTKSGIQNYWKQWFNQADRRF